MLQKNNQSHILNQVLVILVILLSLFLRLNYLTNVASPYYSNHAPLCGGDAITYDIQAQLALIGKWPDEKPFVFGPLYSIFLFLVYTIFGINYIIPLVIQMMLSSVIVCAAIYWIGKYIFSPLTGLLAALACALYGPLIVYGICYAQDALTVPLFILTFFFLLKFFSTHQKPYIVLSGLMLGLGALARPTILSVVPIIIVFLISEIKILRRINLYSILFLFSIGIIILPFTIHNYRVTGKIIFISDNGGFNFYLGNNFYGSAIGPIDIASQYGQRLGNIFYFPEEFSKIKNEVEAGQTSYLKQTMAYIFEHPWDWLDLMVKKMDLMFLEPDWKLVPQYAGPLISLKKTPMLQFIPLEWAALIILAILNICFIRNKFAILIFSSCVSLALVTSLFFVQFRFRLPITPFLLFLTTGLIRESKYWLDDAPNKFIGLFILSLLAFPFVPSILPFIIILLVMMGLFASKQSKRFQWIILLSIIYIIIISFSLCMKAIYDETSQEQDDFVGPAIWGDTIIGQTFSPNCNGLNQIQVELSRLSFNSKAVYYFHLVSDLQVDQKIYSTTFNTTDIGRWSYKTFNFPAIWDSQGKSYFFFIESSQAHPEDSITVRLNGDLPNGYGQYNQGNVYGGKIDNLFSFPADLAFMTHCDENYLQLGLRTINALFYDK